MPSHGLEEMSLSRTAMLHMPCMIWYGRLTDGAPDLSIMLPTHAWTSACVMLPICRSAHLASQWHFHALSMLEPEVAFQNGFFSAIHWSCSVPMRCLPPSGSM